MAGNSFQLSQPGIDNLNKSLDKLVVSMNSLEKRLASLQKNSQSAFAKVFGSQKDFDAIVVSINKLDLASGKSFNSITTSIRKLVLGLASLSEGDGVKAIESLGKLTPVLSKFIEQVSNVSKKKLDIKTFEQLNKFLDQIIRIGGPSVDVSQTVKTFDLLNDLFVSSVNKLIISIDAISANLKLSRLTKIGAFFIGIALVGAQVIKLKPVAQLLSIVTQLLKNGLEAVVNLTNALPSFKDTTGFTTSLASLFSALTKTLKVKLDAGNILRLVASVAALGAVFVAINKIPSRKENIDNFTLLIKALSLAGKRLLELPNLSTTQIVVIAKYSLVTGAIAAFFATIARISIPAGGENKVTALSQSIGDIVKSFGSLSAVVKSGVKISIKDIFELTKVSFAMGTLIRSVLGAFRFIASEKISASATFITGIVGFFEGILTVRDILQKLPTGTNIFTEVVAQAVGGIRSLIIGIKDATKDLNLGRIAKISILIPAFITFSALFQRFLDVLALARGLVPGPIRDALAGIVGILFAAPDTGIINKFKDSISALAEATKALGKLAVNFNFGDIIKVSFALSAIIAPLKSLTTSLGKTGLSGDFPKIVNSLSTIITAILGLEGAAKRINVKDILKFSGALLAISAVVRVATNIAITEASLPRVKALAEILRAIGTTLDSIRLAIANSKGTPITGILNLLKIFVVFKLLIGAVFSAVKGQDTAKVQAAAAILNGLGSVFQNLVSLLASLSKSRNLDKKGFEANIVFIKDIFSLTKTLNTKNAVGGAALVTGIAELLKVLGTLSKSKSFDSSKFKTITADIRDGLNNFKKVNVPKAFVTNLGNLIKVFAGLKDVKFEGLGPALKGLSSLSDVDLSKVNFKGLKNIIKEFAESFKELDKLNVDASKVEKLANAAEKLSRISADTASKSISKGFGNANEGLFDDFLTGFFRQVGLSFANKVAKLFASINPVAIGKSIVAGLKFVFLGIDQIVSDLSNKIRGVGQSLINLGQQLRTSGLSLINSIGLGGVANNAFFQAAVGFDDLSTQVKNFGNLTQDQLKSAQAFSNEIGIKYPQSSNEALQATLNLLKAGLSLNDTFTALPAAADLSSISDSKNLDAASKAIILVTQSFKDFNEETVASFENASVAADLIARAANNSTASVESLTEGLANVGPTAAAFGLSLEDTVAILGQFEDNGIRGAEAGTQLKSVLTNITRSTPAVKAEFARLGVSLTDSEGNFRRINDIVNDLNSSMLETRTVTVAVNNATADQRPRLDAATKAYASAARQVLIYNDGLSTGALDQDKANKKLSELQQVQANAAAVIAEITGSQATTETITRDITRSQADNFRSIQTLAGTFGQAGLNILISSGQDAIAGFIAEMGRLPTAAEQARLLLDNLKGDALQLQGSIESLGTRAFLPLISRVFRPLVKIGRLVVDFFSSLPDPILETLVNAGVLVSILATLVGGLLIAVGVLTQFGGIILTVVATVGGLLVNLPLVVGALAGLVGAFATLVALGAIIVPILLGISSVITTFFRTIENNVGGAGSALNVVQETLGKLFTSVGDIFRIGGDIISTIFGSGLNEQNVSLGERVAAFFTDINDQVLILKEKINIVRDFFGGFASFLALGDEDQTRADLIAEFTAAMPGAPEVVILGRVNDQLNKTKLALSTFATTLAGSSIFQSIIGKDVNQEDILRIFGSIQTGLETARDGIGKSLGAGSSLLLNFLGIKKLNPKQISEIQGDLNDSLSTLGVLVTKGLAKVTGLDLSEALLNFSGTGGKGGQSANFKTGAESLLKTLFASLKTAFFANQAGITDILSGIFNFLTPGKFIVPLLRFFGLDQVADGLSAIFADINTLFRSSIGFIFDLLGGKSLDDALFGNFGTAAKPISRLIKAIGKAIESLVGIFSDLFAVLFPAGVGGGNGSFIENVIDGIASAFEFFTTAVLQPIRVILPNLINILGTLATTVITVVGGLFNVISNIAGPLIDLFKNLFTGDIDLGGFLSGLGPAIVGTLQGLILALPGLVGTLLSGLGALIGSPLLTAIGTDLQQGDFEGAIGTIAVAVSGVIRSGLSRVPGLITDLGTSLGAPLITKIGEALATGDFSAVGDQIKTSIEGAVNSIPSKLVELGTTFGSPFLVKLGEAFSTGDVSGAITAITDSIASVISGALGAIPARLQELGATLNLSFLGDLGLTLEKSELFDKVISGLSNLIALPFETLGTIVSTLSDFGDGLGKLFDNLGKANPIVVGALVLTLGGLFALLTGPAIIAGIGLLGAALAPVLLPILTVAAVLLVLKNGLQAVADVISGEKNVFEGISSFFTGLASDALGLIGIEISPEDIADRITTFFNSVNGLLQIFFANAIKQAGDAIFTIIDGLVGALDDARARIDQASGFASTGTGDIFFGIEQGIKDNNFRAISDLLNEAAEKGLDFQPLNRLLRNNFVGVMETFANDIPKLADFSDADFAAVVNTLVNANALDDAINKLPPTLVPDFYQRLFEVDPKKLAALDFSSIQTQLTTGLSAGLFDFSQVEGFVLSLPDAVLSPAAKAAFIASLKTQITPTTPTEVPLQITPTVLPATDEDKNKVRTDIGLGLLLSGDSGVPVTVPLDVTPTVTPPTAEDVLKIATDSVTPANGVAPAVELPVDIVAISDPETAQAFADALATVTANSDAATLALTTLQGQTALIKDDVTLAGTSVAQYATDVSTNTALAGDSWTLHSGIVALALQRIVDTLTNIKLKFLDIGVEIDKANITYPDKLITLGAAFATMVAIAEPPLIRLSFRLREVAANLQQVLDKLAAVAEAGITVDSSGNGNVPGREFGGSVFAGNLYEVGENNKSELLRIGGKTYLIPGGNGMVVPASSMANAAPPPSLNNARSSTNNNSISIQAPITVSVNAGTNANPQQIGQQVAARISPLIDNLAIDVKRKLTLTGRA